jgi:hypothetical protein
MHRHSFSRRAVQLIALLSIGSSVTGALGQSGAPGDRGQGSGPERGAQDDSIDKQLQQMQQELERLRGDNQAMKGQIDELRAKTDADWLTEARADEIKGLVADVLADADTRASLMQNGVMAGWLDHFFLASPDGRFKLVLDGQMQIRYVYNYRERPAFSFFPNPEADDQHRQGFENTRTRLTFRGHVFSPDWQYLIRSEFARSAGTSALLDAWIRYNLTDEWSLRIGQFKLPFNREELVSPAEQLAVERSIVNEITNLGRSQGVELTYATDTSRISLAVSDGVNRPNQPALTLDTEYAVSARYEHLLAGNWDQFTDFTSPIGDEYGALLGIGGHAQDSESSGVSALEGQNQTRVLTGTADLSLEWGGANAFGALTYQYVDAPGGISLVTGIVIQGGVYVTPKWEFFVRGEYAQADGQSGSFLEVPDLNLVTFGTNYYLEGHDLKWTTDISVGISDVASNFAIDLAGFRADNDQGAPQVVFRTQFQLLF